MKINRFLIGGMLYLLFISCASSAQHQLKEHVLFYSAFDGALTASVAQGDAAIYTAKNYKEAAKAKVGLHDPKVVLAAKEGKFGDALHFKASKTAAVFYKAYRNVGYSSASWSGTISFWLRLDPNEPLPPHYCDPICITDSKWSDAGLWIDFTDHNPRKFRYGAMGDIAVWDPDNDSDESDWNMRTVTVDPSPFRSDEWTHVAMVFSKVNTEQPIYQLYLNGEFQGAIENVDDPFTWEPENGKIMLGLGYVGFMDELAIFDKALNIQEVQTVFQLKQGIKTLFE